MGPSPLDQQQAFNPADLTDPDQQRKIAENVLQQVGLHPNQMGARNLLDMHFQGPTVNPEVSSLINPTVASDPGAAAAAGAGPTPPSAAPPVVPPAVEATAPTGTADAGRTSLNIAPQLDSKNTSDLGTPGASSTPYIPGPTFGSNPIVQNTNDAISGHQNELKRLIDTGSGISQIHNPFLRGLAHAGEIGGTLIAGPGIDSMVSGTEGHHNQLVRTEQGAIDSSLKNAQEEASIGRTDQKTQTAASNMNKPTELGTWIQQNPGKPLSELWKEKAAAKLKLTPDEELMKNLTDPENEGGKAMDIPDAYAALQKAKTENKPPTATKTEHDLEALLAKTMPDGVVDPGTMSDPKKLGALIAGSALTPEEKAELNSHFILKTTPVSQGGIARQRTGAMMNRLTPSINTDTGSLGFTTPQKELDNPGHNIPAAPGAAALSKETIFNDLHYNASQVESALHGLKNGFDTKARAQLALMLSSSDPHKALDAFMHSSTGQTLTPDQADFVTALASFNENALAMRSVQGLGSGSDEMRAAIKATLPGSATPNSDYAQRQMDLFNGTIQRLEQGVPKTNIHPTTPAPTPKTGEHPKFQVTVGKDTFTFKDQKSLDDFKKEAGLTK